MQRRHADAFPKCHHQAGRLGIGTGGQQTAAGKTQGISPDPEERRVRHGNHRHRSLKSRQNRFPPEGTIGHHHGPQMIRLKVSFSAPSICRNKIGRPAQAHKHAGQKGVAQLLSSGPGIELGIERQRSQGRRMGTGHLQMTHQQMTDDSFSTSQRIDPLAMAIGRQGLALGILRETRHHSNRCRSGCL